MDKKFVILIVLILGVGAYWFFSTGKDSENSELDEISLDKKEKIQSSDTLSTSKKVRQKRPPIKKKKESEKEELNNGVTEIMDLVSTARREIRDCEIIIGDMLGDEEAPVNLEEMDESQLFALLDEFDHARISVSSLGRLLEGLAKTDLSKEEDEIISDELTEIRPCKPFQKISFVHFLIKKYQKSGSNESLQGRIKKTIFLYITKELKNVRSISSINMIANIYATLIEEKVIADVGAVKASDFIDDLEDSYDELIDQAEDSLDEFGNAKGTNNSILKKELVISNNYRQRLLKIVQQQQND